MEYSKIKELKLSICPKCKKLLELMKRGDSYFEKCPECDYSRLVT